MKTAIKIALFILTLAAFPARAQEPAPHVQIKLLPQQATITPGSEILIGIDETIEPAWHTYWKNPGDSGTPPKITWDLPAGFAMGDIEWPAPSKLPQGPLMNYGYENHVTLLQKLKAPASLPSGPLNLTAHVEILVCKEECIPEEGTYTLMLNAVGQRMAFLPPNAASSIPAAAPWNATYKEDNGSFILSIDAADIPKALDLSTAQFFPEDWGVIKNAAPVAAKFEANRLIISQPRDQRSLHMLGDLTGLFAFGKGADRKVYAITAQKDNAPVAAKKPAPPLQQTPILQALFFALLGGLILNLMPCVFPVLSIKALSLVKTAEKKPRLAQLHGLAYSAGVISSFVAIALLLIILRSAGSEIGWGFQLQNPIVVTLLAWLLFVIGLNLAGLFEVGGHLGNVGQKLTQGEGLRNSFFTGILATLVATPCTAPFMGVAVGVALLQPVIISLCIFAAMGLGLAAPYLALSFAPALRKQLPKPGAWMDVFKQALAFPMFASSAWLIWVLSQQQGSMGVFGALMGLVFISLGIWLLRQKPKAHYWRYKARVLAAIAFVCAFTLLPASRMEDLKETRYAAAFGETWSPEKLEKILKSGDPVFVEMTAAWCITCKVNHAVAIDRDATRELFRKNRIHFLIGDWTSQDANITEYLNGFGRNGVPLYAFYGRADMKTGARPAPRLLPQILTPGIVAEAVQ